MLKSINFTISAKEGVSKCGLTYIRVRKHNNAMRKYYSLILILFFLTRMIKSYGQKEADEWPIGLSNVCSINFIPSLTIDTLCPDFSIYYDRGGASICDSNGSLLFISNGVKVYNNTCNLIDNAVQFNSFEYDAQYSSGTNLFQDNIALPKKDNTYYLLAYVQSDSATIKGQIWDMIQYHVIDMDANGGQGSMISKSNVLLKDSFLNGSEFTACRHGNGRDWWVIKTAASINRYYKFLVTPDTIIGPMVQTLGYDTVSFYITPSGQAVFSRDGTKYARSTANGKLLTLDFDRCSGELTSNRKIWVIPDSVSGLGIGARGVSFSPNGRFVYANTWDQIYQYDLDEPDSSQAMLLVADVDSGSFAGYTNEFLAPDGRIYIDNYHGTSNYLSYISNPDVKGVGCGFCQACLYIPNVGAKGIQNKVNFRLGREIGSACDTIYNDLPKLEAQQNPFIHLQPNPANNEVMITYRQLGNEPATLLITNAVGQEVYRMQLLDNNINYTLNTSSFNKGLYQVTLSTTTGQATTRLSVVH